MFYWPFATAALPPSQRADLAIVDLTITSDREGKVDFTTPFLSLGKQSHSSPSSGDDQLTAPCHALLAGIQVLYRKPTKLPPSLMSFLSPFSNDVWLLMTAAYTGVSLLMFVMAR